MDVLYTRLYVNAAVQLNVLRDVIATELHADVRGDAVFAKDVHLELRTSDDFDSDVIAADPSHYIYYPYSVEIEARGSIALEHYLEQVGKVMRVLANRGCSVVASCDWEDLLPGGGKIGGVFAGSASSIDD